MKKRILCLILAAAAAFSLTACTNTDTGNTAHVSQTTAKAYNDDTGFKLSYSQSDSIDPFKSKSLNNQVLSSLVFDSLFKIDTSYDVSPCIATGYEYTNGKTLAVNIDTSKTFSNGSPVTADDITYSFRAAKKSPAYGTALKGISSASANGGQQVIFSLSYKNPYAQNLLTFPIACTKDDDNGYPVGSGRYYYAQNGSELCLKAKTDDGFNPRFTTISLVNIAAADSTDNAVNIGNISFAFRDMSVNTSKRITAAKKPVMMNNLVYIGVNSFASVTSNALIRKAISLAVDRASVSKSAYADYGTPATSVFNPQFDLAKDTEIFSGTADTSAAKQAIAQSGIEPSKLSLTLLINSNSNRSAAANLIKSQLEAVGFSVNIIEEKYSAYKSRIENSNFDLYIGETKITDDMNLYSFLRKSGNTHYGIDLETINSDNQYKKYLDGDAQLGDFILSFSEETPYIPLIYHKGMICYSKSLSGDMQGYYGNYFSNIEDWYFNR